MSIDPPIADFLAAHHVVGLCVADEVGPWAASCFYAFDPIGVRLLVLSSVATRHGRALARSPRTAGTVAGQPARIEDIRGVQFTARAELAEAAALDLYVARHPVKYIRTDLWSLWLDTVKFTDNSVTFGHKSRWRR